jgi:hypothetical protein
MCFFHDADWTPSVYEEDTRTATERMRCDECCGVILPGERYGHIFGQEHEECVECGVNYEAVHDEPVCSSTDGRHRFGESYEHVICERCEKLRTAIQRVEEDDGCSGSETVPLWGELREAFSESDHAQEYLDRARTEYPELAMCGHLDRFYRHTREYQDCFEGDEWYDCDDIGEPVEQFELGGEGG